MSHNRVIYPNGCRYCVYRFTVVCEIHTLSLLLLCAAHAQRKCVVWPRECTVTWWSLHAPSDTFVYVCLSMIRVDCTDGYFIDTGLVLRVLGVRQCYSDSAATQRGEKNGDAWRTSPKSLRESSERRPENRLYYQESGLGIRQETHTQSKISLIKSN